MANNPIDISVIAKNVKKKRGEITEDLADQTGMSTSEIKDTLPKVASTMRGAEVAQAKGADPTQMSPDDLKKLDPSQPADVNKEQMLTMALMGTLPSLIGYALGGARAGQTAGAGAQQGVQMVAQGIEQDKERQVKLAQHKESMAMKDREIASNERKSKTDEEFKRGELALKKQELAQNAELKKLDKGNALAKVNFDQAHTLRNEYMNNPMTKRTSEITDAYRRMQEVASNSTPASDISLIYNFMKINDPGSTVREGEFATAQNASGVPERLVNLYNKALKGTRLSDEQRTDFLGQAQNLALGQIKNQEKLDATYSGLSQKYGISPDQVLVNFGQDTSQGLQSAKTLAELQKQKASGGGGLPGPNSAHAAPAMPDFNQLNDEDLKKYLGIK